jgi:hypothetical protein
MKLETQKRLGELFERVVKHLCLVSGTKSYEDAIGLLRSQFRNSGTSPAAWLHRMAQEIYPMNEPDSVDPERFYDILGLIDTREKAHAVLAGFPEEAIPQIEQFLKFLLKEYLPGQRLAAQEMVKALPQRRSGGPKPTMPGEAECRQICDEIFDLHRRGVPKGNAQRRAAQKRKLSLRTIQRIWAQREKWPVLTDKIEPK